MLFSFFLGTISSFYDNDINVLEFSLFLAGRDLFWWNASLKDRNILRTYPFPFFFK